MQAICLDLCRGGGIGRRAGFRCQWPQGRAGSSPVLGTIGTFYHVPEEPVSLVFTGPFLTLISRGDLYCPHKYRQFDGIYDGAFQCVSELINKVPSKGGWHYGVI